MEVIKMMTDYGISVVIAGVFLYAYLSDKKIWQRSQEIQFDRSNEINDKLASIIAENTAKINIHESILDHHANDSKQSFDELNLKVDRIDSKLEILQSITNELATKEMAEEIKREVRQLKTD